MSLCLPVDVFVRVSMVEYTQQTHTVEASLSPCWDETLIFSDMRIFGVPSVHMISEPVSLLVQLYDRDDTVSYWYISFCAEFYMWKQNKSAKTASCKVKAWIQNLPRCNVRRISADAGKIFCTYDVS